MSAPLGGTLLNKDSKVSDEKHEYLQQDKIDLANNDSAKIHNPLAGIPREQLLEDVEAFTTLHGLEDHVDAFKKGALLAQSPQDLETIPELTEEDREWIRLEKTRKWKQPRAMYLTVVLCSIGAAVQGWDQTGSNGANLSFPREFGIESIAGQPNQARNEWLIGLVNAAPYLSASMFGAWLTDPTNNLLGRRGTIFLCGVFCTLPVIGSAFTQTWEQLFICRLLLGIGMGMKATTVPVFAAENTPASIRGGLVMSWQMWTAFGILLGFSANLALFQIGPLAWRLELGSAFIPAIPLMAGIYLCPESPRWLMKKGRFQKAFRSFLRLRNSEVQAARDMYYIAMQIEMEAKILGVGNVFTRALELFTIPRNRRATLASFTVMIAQQMCGINIIAFYSSSVFSEAGYSTKNALLASWGFGLVNWVFAFPAVFTIDTLGRRNLLLFTFPNMAWSLLAAGLCFLIQVDNGARVALIAFFVFLFAAFYSPGEGPVPFTYSAEAFPLSHREVGMLLGSFGPTGAFGFYAGLNMVAFVMIFFFVPETKQRTLEELDYVFAVPTKKHCGYQFYMALPYFVNRWVLRNKDAHLEELYDFAEVDATSYLAAPAEKGADQA